MRFAVLYSKKDIAGKKIAEQLKKFYIPQIPIFKLNKETIYSENIDKNLELKNIDFIVFASRHASKEQRKTLSLHAPGNWRSQKSVISDDSQNSSERILKNADFGGKPGKICLTSALILKYLFQELNKNATGLNYECTLECTHHGPYLEKPCCFIELGSGEQEWKDEKAAEVIAKTISSLQNYQNNHIKNKIAIGVGGKHYCSNFNKIQLNSEYAISHIIPSYHLPLTQGMLKEAIEKTQEAVETVIIDWKSMNSEERKQTIEITKKSGLEVKRTSEIEK